MNREMSEHGKVMYKFIAKIGNELEKKYGMPPSSIGGGAKEDGIGLMVISFDRSGISLTEEEARKLIINCVDDFLEAVNSDEQIRPFLKDYPFTAKNLDLTIFNYNKDRVLHYFPHIAIVTNSEGKVGFLTKAPTAKYGYHTEKYETYDEAVETLKRENRIGLSD